MSNSMSLVDAKFFAFHSIALLRVDLSYCFSIGEKDIEALSLAAPFITHLELAGLSIWSPGRKSGAFRHFRHLTHLNLSFAKEINLWHIIAVPSLYCLSVCFSSAILSKEPSIPDNSVSNVRILETDSSFSYPNFFPNVECLILVTTGCDGSHVPLRDAFPHLMRHWTLKYVFLSCFLFDVDEAKELVKATGSLRLFWGTVNPPASVPIIISDGEEVTNPLWRHLPYLFHPTFPYEKLMRTGSL